MNCAYVSYICNDNYLNGLIALINSLIYHKTKFELIVMVTKDISQDSKSKLQNYSNVVIHDVPEIYYSGSKKHLMKDRYGNNDKSWMMFTKFNIFNIKNYERLLYIDADTITLQNIDHIFETNINDFELYAVLGGSKMLNYSGIEGGVLYFKPNNNLFIQLMNDFNNDMYDVTMTDQSFINDFFKKRGVIKFLDEKWNRLTKKNKNITGCYIYHWNSDKPWINNKVLHYDVWLKYFNFM